MGDHTTPRSDPRTGLVELSPAECWELLESHDAGRLAVAIASDADIFPVNYRVREGEIVVRTEAGTKLAASTLLGRVAFEVDELDSAHRTGWSVVVHGHGREPRTVEEVAALDDLGLEPWAEAERSRWLVITPQSVSGRRVAARRNTPA